MISSAPSLNSPEVRYQLLHMSDDRTGAIIGSSVFFFLLALGAVVLRFLSRRVSQQKYLWDDWTILVALFLYLIQESIEVYTARKGWLGKHAVSVGIPNVEKYLRSLFVYTIVYPLGFPLTKISACLFYLRIFPAQKFRQITKITIVVFIVWIFTTITVVIFQCKPVEFFWKQATPGTEGQCINQFAFYYASTGNNIASDLWTLSLPIPLVMKLQVSLRRRVAICGIFMLGFFVTLISVIRIFYISKTLTADPTWSAVDEAIWTNLEGSLGITCACLPSYGPLFSFAKNSKAARWVGDTYTNNSEKFHFSWSRSSSNKTGSSGTMNTSISGGSGRQPPYGRIAVQNQVEMESQLVPRRYEEFQCECGRSIVIGNAVKKGAATEPKETQISIKKADPER